MKNLLSDQERPCFGYRHCLKPICLQEVETPTLSPLKLKLSEALKFTGKRKSGCVCLDDFTDTHFSSVFVLASFILSHNVFSVL